MPDTETTKLINARNFWIILTTFVSMVGGACAYMYIHEQKDHREDTVYQRNRADIAEQNARDCNKTLFREVNQVRDSLTKIYESGHELTEYKMDSLRREILSLTRQMYKR